jgi:hypothetical protein
MNSVRRKHLLGLTQIGQQALSAADFSTDETRTAPLGRGETVTPAKAVRNVLVNDGRGAKQMTMEEYGRLTSGRNLAAANRKLTAMTAARRKGLLSKSEAGRCCLQAEPEHPRTQTFREGSTLSSARGAELLGKSAIGRFVLEGK